MTDKPQPPWRPLSRLPLFTTMIDEAVAEAQTMPGDVQTGWPKRPEAAYLDICRNKRGPVAGLIACQDAVFGGVVTPFALYTVPREIPISRAIRMASRSMVGVRPR